MNKYHKTIREYVIEAAELDEQDIAPDEDLITLGLDSLAGLEITVNLEKKYGVKIPPSRYEEMTTIAAISSIVEQLVAEKNPVAELA